MSALQQMLAGVSSVAAFTPASLNPKVWLDARNATYTGANLSAITNAGSIGGTPAVVGTINAGATLGGMPTMRFNATSKQLNLAQGAWGATGVLSYFWYGAALGTTGDQGILNRLWPGSGTNTIAFYLCNAGGTTFDFGNNCCSVSAGTAPSFSRANFIADTNEHALYGQLAATNALYLDGVSQSLGATQGAAAPNYSAATWNYGVGATGAESINADCGVWLTFDFALSGTEITNLTNYYMNM